MSFFGMPYELSVQPVCWGARPELVEVLDLAARGLVRATAKTFSLDHAMDAHEELKSGSITGRAVVVPSDPPAGGTCTG